MMILKLALCLVVATEAFVASTNKRSALLSRLHMNNDYTASAHLDEILASSSTDHSIRQAEVEHGMPWKTSIDKSAFKGEDLLYMKFWEWHVGFLEENLNNLQVVSCSNGKTDFSYKANPSKKARIVNMCLTSDEYRKIRLTYYDAGDNTQVYNAVLYPDPKYDLPVLGVDLLAFNRKKFLSIVDFQPLHKDHDFSEKLSPIKSSYDNLSGKMSSKFYDETQFFSQDMLFARFEDETIIENELFPAFQGYVETHLDLIRNYNGVTDEKKTLERQQAYDTYSADRDPATGLFMAMFGQDWALDFVHDFLFSMSQRPEPGTPIAIPSFMGGPPQNGKPATNGKASRNPYAQPQAVPVR